MEQDTLYALPTRLIDAICREMDLSPKKEFFNKDEETFERDLAKKAGAGFFLKGRFTYPPLTGDDTSEQAGGPDEATRKQMGTSRRLREQLNEMMREDGRTNEQIQKYWDDQKRMEQKIDGLKWGYAGWLVTDPGFREARDDFRRRWKDKVDEVDGFSFFPMSFIGEPPRPPREGYEEFYEAYVSFCQEWGLKGLATWDLPVPLQPEIFDPAFQHLPAAIPAGVTVFAPWYLLRAKDINLYEVAAHKRTFDPPHHLLEWLDKKTGKFGPHRFARMLKLYVYLELALKRRYADRLKDKLDKIQNAFGVFFCDDPNKSVQMAANIEKDRKEWKRRLTRSGDTSSRDEIPPSDSSEDETS